MFDILGNPIHFTLVRTTDASVEPLTTAEAKVHLRIPSSVTDEDSLIASYIKAARKKVEGDTGRALINQSWTLSLDRVPASRRPILLPVGPVSAITSITSYSVADAASTVGTAVYRLDASSLPARVVLKDGQDWPSDLRPENAIEVVFVAGYGAASTNIKDTELVQAMYLLIGHWNENREAVNVDSSAVSVPLGYEELTKPLKVAWL